MVDESSPLFGLNFEEHPANKIYIFSLSIDAVQDLTKASVNVQTQYGVEDIMIGHWFQSLMHFDDSDTHATMKNKQKWAKNNHKSRRVCISDYSKMSDTEPYPVWYPAKAGAYDTTEKSKVQAKLWTLNTWGDGLTF